MFLKFFYSNLLQPLCCIIPKTVILYYVEDSLKPIVNKTAMEGYTILIYANNVIGKEDKNMRICIHTGRFFFLAFVLLVVGWIVPGFKIAGFANVWGLAFIIATSSWIIETILRKHISPFGRGVIGFMCSACVIWFAQFWITSISITFIGSLLAAFIIGMADLFIPIKRRNSR